jgi:UbiD family decarboxylase
MIPFSTGESAMNDSATRTRAGYADLREYLQALERHGKLKRIAKAVEKDWEIAAVGRVNFQSVPEERRCALFFENVKGFDAPVTFGLLGGSRAIYALALGARDVDDIADCWTRALRNPIAPEETRTAPVHEHVHRDDEATLLALPVPTWTVEHDPGPYLTAPFVITRDPDTGVQNIGTYRCQIKGPRRIGMFIAHVQHGRKHIEANNARGRPTPVAIALGTDPSIGLCSVAKIPYGVDELAVAGALRGEPVPVVRAKTVDLMVPANAEIVIEGTIRANETEWEGPFGEFTGYMGPRSQSFVIDVSAITHRERPIFQAFLSQMPPSESSTIRGYGREAAIRRHLLDLKLPVKDVHLLHAGGASNYLAISIRKEYPGQAQQVLFGAWSVDPTLGKFTVIVDDDIDVRDPFMVNWALAFRVQPASDILVAPHTVAGRLDPSQAAEDVPQQDPSRRTSSKIGIDATKKHTYPPIALPPAEHLQRVRANWKDYGI